MNIPQAEIDKLNDISSEEVFDEHAEVEEEVIEDEPVKRVEEKVSVSPEEDTVADKARIPYSRFEKVNERAIRAEERLRILEETRDTQSKTESNVDVPPEWIELYGDSDAAKRAYTLQVKLNNDLQQKASEKALEAIDSRNRQQEKAIEENLETIEIDIENFAKTLGRKLTETEENAILDIQDEFTQKDADGNYLSQLLSPEKAFEIYSLRQEKAVSTKKQAKNRVLSVTGASSEGDISNSSDANYNPQAWGGWRDKI